MADGKTQASARCWLMGVTHVTCRGLRKYSLPMEPVFTPTSAAYARYEKQLGECGAATQPPNKQPLPEGRRTSSAEKAQSLIENIVQNVEKQIEAFLKTINSSSFILPPGFKIIIFQQHFPVQLPYIFSQLDQV